MHPSSFEHLILVSLYRSWQYPSSKPLYFVSSHTSFSRSQARVSTHRERIYSTGSTLHEAFCHPFRWGIRLYPPRQYAPHLSFRDSLPFMILCTRLACHQAHACVRVPSHLLLVIHKTSATQFSLRIVTSIFSSVYYSPTQMLGISSCAPAHKNVVLNTDNTHLCVPLIASSVIHITRSPGTPSPFTLRRLMKASRNSRSLSQVASMILQMCAPLATFPTQFDMHGRTSHLCHVEFHATFQSQHSAAYYPPLLLSYGR